jgi:MFS family permease
VFLAWCWLMGGANLAAPLYERYAEEFGFPAIVLTTVFATYAVTLVLTLLTCGRLADRFGRRPVITAGLGVGVLALLVSPSRRRRCGSTPLARCKASPSDWSAARRPRHLSSSTPTPSPGAPRSWPGWPRRSAAGPGR